MWTHRTLTTACAIGLAASSATAQFTITLEPLHGSMVSGSSPVIVEAFIQNNGPDFLILGYEIDLPCSLPGQPGSSGTIMTVGNALSVGNMSNAASGDVPWVFRSIPPNTSADNPSYLDNGGLRPINQAACRLAGSPNAGEPAYTIPAGTRRYLGTWRYSLSQDTIGTFTIPYENRNTPCQLTDLSVIIDANNQCVDATFVPSSLSVETGLCCDCGSCVAVDVTELHCLNDLGGRTWYEGQICLPGACEYDLPECCDDGQFCNGLETLNFSLGQCIQGTPPSCPGGSACVNAFCNPALNGGHGACTTQPLPNGSPCDDGNACTTGEQCSTGNCSGQPVVCNDGQFCNGVEFCTPSTGCVDGTPPLCPGSTPCVDAICNPALNAGTGACTTQPRPNGSSCDDANACTVSDQCSAGICSGQPCDDGLFCNGIESCSSGAGCVAGSPPCDSSETCDEMTDACHPAVIPTASGWGLLIFALLLTTGAKLRFGARQAVAP